MNYLIQRPAPRKQSAVFLDRGDNPTARAIPPKIRGNGRGSITVSTLGNHLTKTVGPSFAAPIYSTNLDVESVSGSTLTCNNLHKSDSYKAGVYEGGTVSVWRVVSGSIVFMGEHSIASVALRTTKLLMKSAEASETGSYRWSPPGWHRPSATEYFTVAEIDANGDRGPLSTPVPFTTAADPAKGTFTNTTVSASSYSGNVNNGLSAPTGVTVTPEEGGITAHVQWTAEAGKKYIVFRSEYPQFDEVGDITLAGSPDIQADDLFVVRNRIDHTKTRDDLIASRVWNDGPTNKPIGVAGLARFSEDMEGGSFEYRTDSDGSPYLRITVEDGKTETLQQFTHAGSTWSKEGIVDPNGFYPRIIAGQTYNLTTEARVVSGSGSLLATMSGVDVAKSVIHSSAFSEVVTPFTAASEPGGGIKKTTLDITGPIVLDVKLFAVHDDSAGPMYWTPQELDDMTNAQPRFTRLHFNVKSRPWSFDVQTMIRVVGIPNTKGNGLHRLLENLAIANDRNGGNHAPTSPWVQVPWHFSDEELQFLLGYYYMPQPATSDTSQAAQGANLRIQLGQTVPWADVFPEVMWECANENWNPLTNFWPLPNVSGFSGGQVNGMMLDRIADIAAGVPGYSETTTLYYLGGWGANAGWNEDSAASSIHADVFGPADYTGGWDVDEKAPGTLSDADDVAGLAANNYIRERQDKARTIADLCVAASQGRSKPIFPMIYEAGPGYQISGLNGAVVTVEESKGQEAFAKGWVGGTATFAAFLLNSAEGYVSNNFFTFTRDDGFTSHSSQRMGGAPSGAWIWFEFMQQNLVGQVTKMETQHADPHSAYAPANGRPVVSVFRVQTDAGVRYVFINHDSESAHDVRVMSQTVLPAGARIARMTGDKATSNVTRDTKDNLAINLTDASALIDDRQVTVPLAPGEAAVVMW